MKFTYSDLHVVKGVLNLDNCKKVTDNKLTILSCLNKSIWFDSEKNNEIVKKIGYFSSNLLKYCHKYKIMTSELKIQNNVCANFKKEISNFSGKELKVKRCILSKMNREKNANKLEQKFIYVTCKAFFDDTMQCIKELNDLRK